MIRRKFLCCSHSYDFRQEKNQERQTTTNRLLRALHLLSNPQDVSQQLEYRGRCSFCAACPRDFFKMDRTAKFTNFFQSTYTPKQLFTDMPNSRLPTNFQRNIFIFETRVSLQTLLQSLKQNENKSAWLGNPPNQPSFAGDLVLHANH